MQAAPARPGEGHLSDSACQKVIRREEEEEEGCAKLRRKCGINRALPFGIFNLNITHYFSTDQSVIVACFSMNNHQKC